MEIVNYILTIQETKNNIFVSFYDKLNEKLLYQYSSGMVNMKGPKKRTPLAGELIGKKLGDSVATIYKKKKIGIHLKGKYGLVAKGVLRGLQISNSHTLEFIYIKQIKGLPHNGVRLKGVRRL